MVKNPKNPKIFLYQKPTISIKSISQKLSKYSKKGPLCQGGLLSGNDTDYIQLIQFFLGTVLHIHYIILCWDGIKERLIMQRFWYNIDMRFSF